MGSIVSKKDQLEHQAMFWRITLERIMECDPTFAERYHSRSTIEAVVSEIEALYKDRAKLTEEI